MTTPIIGPLPAVILPGQPVVAGPVMADLNWIRDQVNTNVPATSGQLSRVMVQCIGAANLASGVPLIVGSAANVGNVPVVNLDTLGEFTTSNGRFTASKSGVYQIMVNAMGIPNGSTLTGEPFLVCRKNGSPICQNSDFCFVESHLNLDILVATNFAVVQLAVNDILTATATMLFSGGTALFQFANLSIIGLG